MTQKAPMEELLGSSVVLKMLDVFLTHPSLDYSKKELAEAADVAEISVYRNWDKLEKFNLLEETKKYGKTQLYGLNTDSEVFKKLFKLDQVIRDKLNEEDMQESNTDSVSKIIDSSHIPDKPIVDTKNKKI